MVLFVLASLACIAGISAERTIGAPFPALFLDPYGSFSNVYLSSWQVDALPLRYPDALVEMQGQPISSAALGGSLPADEVAARVAELHRSGAAEVTLTFAHGDERVTVTRPIRALGFAEVGFFFGFYTLVAIFILWSGLMVIVLAGRHWGALAYAFWALGAFVF